MPNDKDQILKYILGYIWINGSNGGISFALATLVDNYNLIRSDACLGIVKDSVEELSNEVTTIEQNVENNTFEIIQIKSKPDLVNDADSVVGNEYNRNVLFRNAS